MKPFLQDCLSGAKNRPLVPQSRGTWVLVDESHKDLGNPAQQNCVVSFQKNAGHRVQALCLESARHPEQDA